MRHDSFQLDEPLLSSSSSSLLYDKKPPNRGNFHWIMAGLIVFGFSAPAVLVSVPHLVGIAGYDLGLGVSLIIFAASIGGSSMILEIMIANPTCENLPDLAYASMGARGRQVAILFQMLNFVFYSPVSLFINGLALQGMLGRPSTDCIDFYILIISVFCFMTTQARVLNNTQSLALLSLTALIIALSIDIGVVMTYDNPEKNPAQLFGHPSPQTTTKDIIQTLLALTTPTWAFVPCFITVEIASSMSTPKDFLKSTYLAGLLMSLLFLGLGLIVVQQWGWDLPAPIYDLEAWPNHILASRIMQALLLLANVVSYALSSIPLVRFCQKAWLPTFKDDWSWRSVWTYLLISLPTFLFGLGLSVLIGNLLILLAFMTALSVPWVNQILPPIFYYHWRHGSPRQRQKSLSKREWLLMIFVELVGMLNFIVCLVGAIGKIGIKELRGPTVIGCGKWTLYSNADEYQGGEGR